MTDDEINTLLEAVALRKTGAQAAMQRLREETAYDDEFVEYLVFTALGGSDLVETDGDGVEVYYASRRPVAEVLKEMEG